ncbi:hypothetical protein LG204_06115 [Methylovorus menthalis]|uniref:hypothetical protein n=1 Tax=Methylovorus menthalis TaxID=1002227 RepID=UPI001E473C90|nr:hypothetical protein [Methylovorus menthalis]MCB4810886.1 hypothetical protein [Methylovorus menthalis]
MSASIGVPLLEGNGNRVGFGLLYPSNLCVSFIWFAKLTANHLNGLVRLNLYKDVLSWQDINQVVTQVIMAAYIKNKGLEVD